MTTDLLLSSNWLRTYKEMFGPAQLCQTYAIGLGAPHSVPSEGWKFGNLLLDKIANPSAEKEDRLSQSKTINSSCRNHAEKRLIVCQVD